MTDEEKKREQERRELNLLINRGAKIAIERTVYVRQSGILGRFKKRVKKVEKVEFVINEPTLSTLDRLAAEQLDIDIDEKLINDSNNWQCEVKKLTAAHLKRMARIIAIAVLGQDYVIAIQHGSGIKYKHDDEKLKELTELFLLTIKPTKLVQIVFMINTMSNFGDFMNSIRLMSASRTTMPILIEKAEPKA